MEITWTWASSEILQNVGKVTGLTAEHGRLGVNSFYLDIGKKAVISANRKTWGHSGYINIYWVIQIGVQVPQSLKSLWVLFCCYPLFLTYWKMTHFKILCSLLSFLLVWQTKDIYKARILMVWLLSALYPTLGLSIRSVFKGGKKQGHREKDDHLPA